MIRRSLAMAFLALGVLQAASHGNVMLPAIISDSMVIQAGKDLTIWGTADAGEAVTVSLAGQTQSTSADADGKWSVKFKPIPASDVGTMTVKGNNTLTVNNILAGSVWVCSGQAGMYMGLDKAHNAATEIPKATDRHLRLFRVATRAAMEPQSDCQGQWVECTPTTVKYFSATAYFFGRELRQSAGVHVGLVQAALGGTPAQSWTSLDGLDRDPALKTAYGDAYRKLLANLPALTTRYEKELLTKYESDMRSWEQAKAAGGAPSAPQKPVAPDQDPATPSALYNGMIAPLTPMTIDGVIFYHGESNVSAAVEYRTLFPRLITDWRAKFGQGDFPFIYGQLPNNGPRKPDPVSSNTAMLREAQSMAMKLPKTGMAVTVDIGEADNAVPHDKLDVGLRMALWAEKLVFGKDVVCSGPLYSSMKVEGGRIRVGFKEVGGGLVIGSAPSIQAGVPQAAPLTELKGFSIAGADQKFVWATAKIEGNNVVVSSPQVLKPVAVRYAWADNPECNLYNKEGLPASPFRTDQWPK